MRRERAPSLHNLPAQRTRLIGRERELIAVREALLRSDGRLVTVTGVGGCGKTRVALAAATNLLDDFADGVWLVEFAPLVDPQLVAAAVAPPFGIHEKPGGRLVDTLTAYLRSRSVLLVLDNCEHLIDACARLAEELLERCPRLYVLATSREPLHIAGEVICSVPPLAAPDPHRYHTPEDLAEYAAVQLFVERVQTVSRGFSLRPENAVAVAQVCARLAGLPLALELAAARVRVLTVGQIAERLNDNFRLLAGGNRTAPSRQQTLEATLDWSHSLLSMPEQVVFGRLAVFAGGWDLEAAEVICTDARVERADVLELVTGLVDRSLVLAQEQVGDGRFRLLEPIRQYAQEHLVAVGEFKAVSDRHATHYLALSEQAAASLWGSHVTGPFGSAAQLWWRTRLDQEHDNLRAGLAWAKEQNEPETLARWCAALWGFWFLQGHFDECRRWVEAALAGGARLQPGLRARLLGPWGMMAKLRGDYAAAVGPFEESLALFRSIGDEWNAAVQLSMVGLVLGCLGNFAEARHRLEDSLAISRALGDAWVVGFGLLNFGQVLRYQGDLGGAHALLEEALPLFQSYSDVFKELVTQIELGGLALEQDDVEPAASLAREGLRLLHDSRMRWYLPEALELVAGLSAALGRPEQAARLFGAAETAREITGAVLQVQGENAYMRDLHAVRVSLGDEAFRRAWTNGRTLSVDRAVDEAFAATQEHAAEPELTPSGPAGPLTQRESEIAQLIARGLTNPQIADQLVISRRTADRHVSNILNKLSFTTRIQVAAWALERGMTAASR